jgi:hypothetical protein
LSHQGVNFTRHETEIFVSALTPGKDRLTPIISSTGTILAVMGSALKDYRYLLSPHTEFDENELPLR